MSKGMFLKSWGGASAVSVLGGLSAFQSGRGASRGYCGSTDHSWLKKHPSKYSLTVEETGASRLFETWVAARETQEWWNMYYGRRSHILLPRRYWRRLDGVRRRAYEDGTPTPAKK